MSIIPPDPGRTFNLLRSVISDLKLLAELNPNQPAYAEALRQTEKAATLLEPITAKPGT